MKIKTARKKVGRPRELGALRRIIPVRFNDAQLASIDRAGAKLNKERTVFIRDAALKEATI